MRDAEGERPPTGGTRHVLRGGDQVRQPDVPPAHSGGPFEELRQTRRRRELLVLACSDSQVGPLIARHSTGAFEGLPDGLAIDEHGGVWIAFYGGGCLARWTVEGFGEVVDVPAPLVTSLAFSRVHPGAAWVATAATPGAEGGAILLMDLGVSGAPVHKAAL